ncbi:hypothetical protein I6I18_09345 [Kytococcus sedentarius]|uniref:Uncharacterized protein n=1 Tax=Kytococcus sedentarius (strain ATCC 14392 / DSM 20547 / JCM 11482 / CCUG 33030 / NBRC 15357 / NCTC 11040 / CCM 314 / 541) TaxID=478801 RepID=C7NF52_KYTSD|nr:hypothetical protein [Kytococcus sedentarius]ACV07305.1 hypothetical protein Ksed_23300 [Kytococcus sedentarius DSM 20547]QQB63267.1 hypothetical protein I6I18_09345 [Kytococcus sedentarius]STX13856.1 Uncharacterised protein [Kytococcus sedentarius]
MQQAPGRRRPARIGLAVLGLAAVGITGCTGSGGDTASGEGSSGVGTPGASVPSGDVSASAGPDSTPGTSGGADAEAEDTGSSGADGADGGSGTESATPEDAGPSGDPGDQESAPASPSGDLPYAVEQQMGVRGEDRRAVQEQLDGLLGNHADEMTSVLPSVEPPGTDVIGRRVWPLGPTSQVVCSGDGSLTWASGPPDTLADDHTLSCTSEGGAPAVDAPRRSGEDPEAVRGLDPRWHQQLALAPDAGSQAWIGVHLPLAEGAPSPDLAAERAAVLDALGETHTTAADRGVVEFDGRGDEEVLAVLQAQAGDDYRLVAHCRGEGAVDLTAVISTYQQVSQQVRCDGQMATRFRAYGSDPARELHLEPAPGTRAVLSFEVTHVEQ